MSRGAQRIRCGYSHFADMDKAKIPQSVYSDLMHLSKVLFPLGFQAVIAGSMQGNNFVGKELVLPPGIAGEHAIRDVKLYKMARSFKEAIVILEKIRGDRNDKALFCDITRSSMRVANLIFEKFKEYQSLPHANQEGVQLVYPPPQSLSLLRTERSVVEMLELGLVIIPHAGYQFSEWVNENTPFVCWHNHPVFSKGSLESSCQPTQRDLTDLLDVTKYDQHERLLKGFMITALNEKKNSMTRAFSLPDMEVIPLLIGKGA